MVLRAMARSHTSAFVAFLSARPVSDMLQTVLQLAASSCLPFQVDLFVLSLTREGRYLS